ncbi:MAG: hypothetical protein MOGMAGMI_01600 [Candidatus Omnitrophica bacterium]|nr:hypothetical protein [Candidatus Omnitrophota bacterium]
MKLLRILGSLWTAVAIIGTLAVMLTVSTLIESHYGTPVAQRWVYRAGWFDVFLALIAVNIICSTLTRWPFKVRHTGFIVTHIGILMVLTGSLLTRLVGVEGQILLYEGEARDRIQTSDLEVVLHRHGSAVASFRLPQAGSRRPFDLSKLSAGLGARMVAYTDHAREETRITEGGPEAPANAALEVRLKSERAGFDGRFQLVENHPNDPHADEIDMGPALIGLARGLPAEPVAAGAESVAPQLIVRSRADGSSVSIDLDTPAAETPVSAGVIRNVRFMPDARVSADNQLVNAGEAYNNPAVFFELVSPDGSVTPVFRFHRFPEFDSSHGRAVRAKDLEVEFRLPGGTATAAPRSGPSLFFHTDGDAWIYVSSSSRGSARGEVRPGESTPTGWMDFAFTVERTFSRAKVQRHITPAAGSGSPAAELEVLRGERQLWQGWVPEAGSVEFTDGPDRYTLGLRRVPHRLPFGLKLKDFRKIDYPGSAEAMAYESDVVLEDPSTSTVIHKTISMNKPLDYAGWRIFQSSFAPDTGQGEVSIFTVAKNPGITLIYSGSVVLFTGVVLVFFVPPLSSLPSNARNRS